MIKIFKIALLTFFILIEPINAENVSSSPDRSISEIREFLKIHFPDKVDQMIIKYKSPSDTWSFYFKGRYNCIDCDFHGAVTDDKKTIKIIGIVKNG